MPKNKMSDLRDHLFETLEDLRDEDKDLDRTIRRAKAVRDIADTLIESAKVEVELLKAMDGTVAPDAFFEMDGRPELDGPRVVQRRRRLG